MSPLAAILAAALLTVEPFRVIDGDTIASGEHRIRLEGIDAPEIGQECQRSSGAEFECGHRAAAVLRSLLRRGPVVCDFDGLDRYGREIAHCRAGRVDLNREMVRLGWAMAFTRYSNEFAADEAEARAAGRGLWAGRFTPPWEWRATQSK